MSDRRPDKYAILYTTVIAFQIGLGGLLTGVAALIHHLGYAAQPRHEAGIILLIISTIIGLGIALFVLTTRDTLVGRFRLPKSAGEAVDLICFLAVLTVIWFPVMIFIFGAGFGLPVLALTDAAFNIADRQAGLTTTVIVLAIALPGFTAGLSTLSRLSWLISVRRNLKNLPASKIRSAAPGLVELRGTAFRAFPAEEHIRNIFHREKTEPFYLQDDTGRILIIPPDFLSAYDARYSLPIHPESLLPVLEEGEPIYVLGFLEENPAAPADVFGPDRLRVGPWETPFGQAYGRILGLFGEKVYGLFRFFDTPDLFLLGRGNEQAVDSRMFRAQRIWIGFSLLVLIGSACLLGLSLDGLFRAISR